MNRRQLLHGAVALPLMGTLPAAARKDPRELNVDEAFARLHLIIEPGTVYYTMYSLDRPDLDPTSKPQINIHLASAEAERKYHQKLLALGAVRDSDEYYRTFYYGPWTVGAFENKKGNEKLEPLNEAFVREMHRNMRRLLLRESRA